MDSKKRIKGRMMKQISRNEAEAIFLTTKVVSTNVEQDKQEMRIFLTLADEKAFLVKYNLMDHNKSYFLEEVRL